MVPNQKRLLVKCKNIDHQIQSERTFPFKKYVEYSFKISTNYKKWTIFRRYTDFENLHKKLINRIPKIPNLPAKTFFNMNDKVIKERKMLLEEYLNNLFQIVNVSNYPDILEFIEIDKDLIVLLIKNNSMIDTSNILLHPQMLYPTRTKNGSKKSRSYDIMKQDNYYKSFLEYKMSDKSVQLLEKSASLMLIEELLYNLQNKSENQCNIIKTFQDYLKSKRNWPRFKSDEISRLFFGDKNNKGLLYHSGRIEHNLIGSISCLEFLAKLVDFEFNPDCELFSSVLKTLTKEQFLSMDINSHLKSNKPSVVESSFKILKALTDDNNTSTLLKEFIKDKEIMNKYYSWLDIY